MLEDLMDRFGEVPTPAHNLLKIAILRAKAHSLYITELNARFGKIKISMKEDAPVKADFMQSLLVRKKENLSFQMKPVPTFNYTYPKHGLIDKDEMLLLEHAERVLEDLIELF